MSRESGSGISVIFHIRVGLEPASKRHAKVAYVVNKSSKMNNIILWKEINETGTCQKWEKAAKPSTKKERLAKMFQQ